MTRKRFKKLLMSHGVSRNAAEDIIDTIVAWHPSTKYVHGYGRVPHALKDRIRYTVCLAQDLAAEEP